MTEAAVRRVGVIGVGRMGLPMARHAAAAGFQVKVFDIDPAACRKAELAGLRVAGSLAELVGSIHIAGLTERRFTPASQRAPTLDITMPGRDASDGNGSGLNGEEVGRRTLVTTGYA